MRKETWVAIAISVVVASLAIVVFVQPLLHTQGVGAAQDADNLPEGFWAPLKTPNWDPETGEPLAILYAAGDLGKAPPGHEEEEYYYFFYPAGVRVERLLNLPCRVIALFDCPEDSQNSRCQAKIPMGVSGAYPLVPGKYRLTCGMFSKEVVLERGENLVNIP